MSPRTRLIVAGAVAVGWLSVTGAGVGGVGAAATVPVPAPIDATGATDVTNALNAFLARLDPGSTVAFARGGRYRIDGTVELRNRRDVTIEGNGATFFAPTDGASFPPPRGGARLHWPRLRQQWRIRASTGITMRDVVVRGANPKGGATPSAYVPVLEGQAGIAVQRSSGVTIESVQVSDTFGDAISVTGGSTNVTVRASTLERTGRQGVAIVSGQTVVVEGNEIRDIGRSVFDLEPAGRGVVRDVHLRKNTVGAYLNFLLAAGGGGPGVTDIWLEGNRVDGGHGVSVTVGIERQRRASLHILDNTGSGTVRPSVGPVGAGLVQLHNLDGVEIRGNRQSVAGGPAITLDRVCAVTISGNDFPGASKESQVVAPCGGTAPAPTGSAKPSTPSTGAAGAAPADGGSDDTGSLVLAGLAGFAAGLGVAGVAFVGWRRGRASRSV